MEALLEWVQENCQDEKYRALWKDKAKVGLRPVGDSENGDRVLVALEPLAKSLRLPLPPNCILTDEKVFASPIGKALKGLDVFTMFAMFLVFHQRLGKESFWRCYINILPRDIHFHPITFMKRIVQEPELEEELQKEPFLLRALQAQDEKLRGEFDRTCKMLELHSRTDKQIADIFNESQPLTYDEFLWGNCMVISRAFNMSEPKLVCMLPFVDSMNHDSRNPTVLWRPKLPHGFFVVTITKALEPGQELCANYHAGAPVPTDQTRSLDHLKQFVMYGFVETSAFSGVVRAANKQPLG